MRTTAEAIFCLQTATGTSRIRNVTLLLEESRFACFSAKRS